jgi:hypothetical protein
VAGGERRRSYPIRLPVVLRELRQSRSWSLQLEEGDGSIDVARELTEAAETVCLNPSDSCPPFSARLQSAFYLVVRRLGKRRRCERERLWEDDSNLRNCEWEIMAQPPWRGREARERLRQNGFRRSNNAIRFLIS